MTYFYRARGAMTPSPPVSTTVCWDCKYNVSGVAEVYLFAIFPEILKRN